MGLSGIADVDAPPLCALGQAALHCWAFCGGWNPALWPVYGALYPVTDWHQLVDTMTAIRRVVDNAAT